jgi:sodium-dependent dicarboxylate transporter 2/3/5
MFLPKAIGRGTSHVSQTALAVKGGISISLDFILPVGTPPNAIAYSTGKVSIGEMIKAGIMLDVGAFIVIMTAYFFWT